jgi:hypothetical protein
MDQQTGNETIVYLDAAGMPTSRARAVHVRIYGTDEAGRRFEVYGEITERTLQAPMDSPRKGLSKQQKQDKQ